MKEPLDREDPAEEEEMDFTLAAEKGRNLPATLAVLAAIVILLSGAVYFFLGGPGEEPVVEEPPPPQSAPGEAAGEDSGSGPAPEAAGERAAVELPPAPEKIVDQPALPPPEPLALPGLDGSDPFVRDRISQLAAHPDFQMWLRNKGLIRRFVVAVDNIADGYSPGDHLPFLRPKEVFPVMEREGLFYLDPAGFRRYDSLARIAAALDAPGCARSYRTLLPLITEAYSDLGYPDRVFEDTLRRALKRLLGVSHLKEEVQLLKGEKAYHFEDPRVEGMSEAEKHLLRMGPENAGIIQGKLREIVTALALTL